LHIIQPREKAGQITYAISVAVHETAWIYLVNNSSLRVRFIFLQKGRR